MQYLIKSNSADNVLPVYVTSVQSELTKQQNMFKIELKLLEDELLTRLSAAESNFLGDNVLVEKLETTKHTAAEIEMKVTTPICLLCYCEFAYFASFMLPTNSLHISSIV